MSTSTLALSGNIAEYYAEHAFREAPVLVELREVTASKTGGDAQMQIAPEQGAFMAMIVRLMNASRIIEIGTFTGYSSLAMALANPAVRITAVDVSADFTAIAREFWKKAGVESRITLRLDGGHAAISDLLGTGEAGEFDLAFLDADKTSYDAYYEGVLQLLRPGGLVMIDNVLWSGDVADRSKADADTVALRKLNDKIKSDSRIEFITVPIGDGLTLAQKR